MAIFIQIDFFPISMEPWLASNSKHGINKIYWPDRWKEYCLKYFKPHDL